MVVSIQLAYLLILTKSSEEHACTIGLREVMIITSHSCLRPFRHCNGNDTAEADVTKITDDVLLCPEKKKTVFSELTSLKSRDDKFENPSSKKRIWKECQSVAKTA